MEDIPTLIPNNPTRFIDQLRVFIRSKQLTYTTEKSYCRWIICYIIFHKKKHPLTMGSQEVDAFLNHLAVNRNASVKTQQKALHAIVFLYQQYFNTQLGKLNFIPRLRPKAIPSVFTHEEAKTVISKLEGISRLIAGLMYGSGLRVMEAVRLRLQDIDFNLGCIIVRDASGTKYRRTLLPQALTRRLQSQIQFALTLHRKDVEAGFGEVYLPIDLAIEHPNAARSPGWQYLFPAHKLAIDPKVGIKRRHHVEENYIQRHVKVAIDQTSIPRKANSHTFRHSFASRLRRAGTDTLNIQEMLGHSGKSTTRFRTDTTGIYEIDAVSPMDI